MSERKDLGGNDSQDNDDDMVDVRVLRCVEALLMAADGPLSLDRLETLLATAGEPDRKALRTSLKALQTHYAERAAILVEVAGGWRFQVREDYAELVGKLWEERPSKLSRALMETLALICYRQPISRGEIEEVRGVSVSSSIIKTLIEREWIRVVGYREVPGRPALFGTTRQFLDDFNVKSLEQLPTLPEIRDLDRLDEAVRRLTKDASTQQSETDEGPEDDSSNEDNENSYQASSKSISDANKETSETTRDTSTPPDALH